MTSHNRNAFRVNVVTLPEDAMRMTVGEFGLYVRLLMEIWDSPELRIPERPLPSALKEYFKAENGFLTPAGRALTHVGWDSHGGGA